MVDIIVEVEGGMVQNVYASEKDVGSVDVLDWDNYKVELNVEGRAYYEDLDKQTKTMTKVY